MTEKNRPTNLREGALSLAIFKNATEHGYAYSSKLRRSYKDQDGQWQETENLREKDHLDASHLFTRGHEFIRKDRERDRREQRREQQHGPSGPER